MRTQGHAWKAAEFLYSDMTDRWMGHATTPTGGGRHARTHTSCERACSLRSRGPISRPRSRNPLDDAVLETHRRLVSFPYLHQHDCSARRNFTTLHPALNGSIRGPIPPVPHGQLDTLSTDELDSRNSEGSSIHQQSFAQYVQIGNQIVQMIFCTNCALIARTVGNLHLRSCAVLNK